jgi:hypothetical protein
MSVESPFRPLPTGVMEGRRLRCHAAGARRFVDRFVRRPYPLCRISWLPSFQLFQQIDTGPTPSGAESVRTGATARRIEQEDREIGSNPLRSPPSSSRSTALPVHSSGTRRGPSRRRSASLQWEARDFATEKRVPPTGRLHLRDAGAHPSKGKLTRSRRRSASFQGEACICAAQSRIPPRGGLHSRGA